MASLRSRLLSTALRRYTKARYAHLSVLRASDLAEARRRIEGLAWRLPPPPAGTRIEALDAGGVPAERVSAPGVSGEAGVLYLHGGGYVLGSARVYRDLAWRLSRACARAVLLPDYRLAPEHPFPAALDDALCAWDWLASRTPGPLALAGDSAGGGLALSLALALAARGAIAPARVVCFSPWTDLGAGGPSRTRNAARDAYIPAGMLAPVALAYAGGQAREDPGVSALHAAPAALRDALPALQVQVSEPEVLLDDSLALVRRMRAAGARPHLLVWPEQPHAVAVFSALVPEARTALAAAGRFCAPARS